MMTRWARRAATAWGISVASASVVPACGGSSETSPDPASGGDSGAGGAGAPSCTTIANDYGVALDEATQCTPDAAVDECTEQVVEGLACSCPSYANPANASAIARMQQLSDRYLEQSCSSGIVCGACAVPIGGRCSAAGRCEGVYAGNGRSCKVSGRIYADGEGGIPDPVSCNQCTCEDGQLACTEIGCPTPCPDGTAFGTGCAECGPVDDCLVVEYACFPACTDACENGFCSNGACVTGLCG
jgi:hypothetical protein